jgi:hypothetical protein
VAAGVIAALAIAGGDAGRFYAACTSGDLDAGDLGHTVAPSRVGPRRVTPGKLVRAAYEQSFESPGLYGLALLGAVAGRLDVVTLYWTVVGPVWFLERTVRYCRRLRTDGKSVVIQRSRLHDERAPLSKTA